MYLFFIHFINTLRFHIGNELASWIMGSVYLACNQYQCMDFILYNEFLHFGLILNQKSNFKIITKSKWSRQNQYMKNVLNSPLIVYFEISIITIEIY